MWESTVGGTILTFKLVGLNNQNFIMEDEQTGTWWQQVTGEAIQGPLKGKRLQLRPFDEVSFGIWKREYPDTRVLALEEEYAEFYFSPREERRSGEGMPLPGEPQPDDPLERGQLVLGLQSGGRSKAYPMEVLRQQNPIADSLGGRAVLLVVAADDRSVRAFDRELEGQRLDLYRKADSSRLLLIDAQTGSEWDFTGTAVSGPLKDRQLRRLPVIKDFWFDWKKFNPDTLVYQAGITAKP